MECLNENAKKKKDRFCTFAEPTTIPNHVDGSMQESNDYYVICNPYLANKNQKGIAGSRNQAKILYDSESRRRELHYSGGPLVYIAGRDDQIATGAKLLEKLLDITHESYGFRADLIEAVSLTNEYQCGKAGFHKDNHRLRCYVYVPFHIIMYALPILVAIYRQPIHVRLCSP